MRTCKCIFASQEYSKILKTAQKRGWGDLLPVFLWNWLTVLRLVFPFYNNNNQSQNLLSSCSVPSIILNILLILSFILYTDPTKKVYVNIETQNDYLTYPQLKTLWIQGPCSYFSFVILPPLTQIIKLSNKSERILTIISVNLRIKWDQG